MTVEPWDIKKLYSLGNTAVVNGVDAVVVETDGHTMICPNCPAQGEKKTCPGALVCMDSIGPDLRWHPLKDYTLKRLRGEV